jgi:hypothetical protein
VTFIVLVCRLHYVLGLETSPVKAHTSPWKVFKHFTDHSIQRKMKDVCYMLGQYGDLNILSYHLLDRFHSTPYQSKEIVLLLNEILFGGKTLFIIYMMMFHLIVLNQVV